MNNDDRGTLFDEAAGRLVRPYAASGGRTEPSHDLDLLALVCSTRRHHPGEVDPELAEVLWLCRQPISVAEISAQLHLPAQVIRVLVSDLIDVDAVQANAPQPYDDGLSMEQLEVLLAGLQQRL